MKPPAVLATDIPGPLQEEARGVADPFKLPNALCLAVSTWGWVLANRDCQSLFFLDSKSAFRLIVYKKPENNVITEDTALPIIEE